MVIAVMGNDAFNTLVYHFKVSDVA